MKFKPYYTREDLDYQMENGITIRPEYLIEHIFHLMDEVERLKEDKDVNLCWSENDTY